MSERSLQNQISGIRANGIPNESTTWLSTSARDASTPRAMITSAGAIVIARRRNSGMRRRMNPCITTCPASVPTLDEERPDASSATPKSMSAPGAEVRAQLVRDLGEVVADVGQPVLVEHGAAITSMLMLTTPAIPIAITTSTSSNRKIRRFSSSVVPTTRCCVSAECR